MNKTDTTYDRLAVMESRLTRIDEKLIAMDRKLDDLLDDYDEPASNDAPEREFGKTENVVQIDTFISDEEIRKQGQKIPYNKLEGREQVRKLKEFLAYIRLHEDKFSAKEFEFAGYADKNFGDIRISDNSRRILGTAYQRAFSKPWDLQFKRGYMFKFEEQKTWQWEDGTTD
jgi:hypothetical protein